MGKVTDNAGLASIACRRGILGKPQNGSINSREASRVLQNVEPGDIPFLAACVPDNMSSAVVLHDPDGRPWPRPSLARCGGLAVSLFRCHNRKGPLCMECAVPHLHPANNRSALRTILGGNEPGLKGKITGLLFAGAAPVPVWRHGFGLEFRPRTKPSFLCGLNPVPLPEAGQGFPPYRHDTQASSKGLPIPMNLTPLIAETQRKFVLLQASQEARRRENAQRIRNADLIASAFMRDHICPALSAAAQALVASGIPAVFTSRIDELSARCLLTVAIDGVPALSLLAFEARLGGVTPAISWTFGGPVHTLHSLSPPDICAILAQFTGSVSRAA
jgi:hypothetical protein